MEYFPKHNMVLAGGFPNRPLPRKDQYRVHLLALGDVGSTLAIGLRLLGGDVISTLGICDLRPGVPERWEFELNQIASPIGGRFPPVEIVDIEHILDCDVFLFCASRAVPDTTVTSGDVRMAQYELNRPLVVDYARRAREERYQGMFWVISDPVDQLCRAALVESQWLSAYQVRGFGLGVMNARARYYAGRDSKFKEYLTDGRAYGPHGEGLVIANSVRNYNEELSMELTELTKHANLQMRQWGYKPYVAPALSSGALSILACLRGHWQYSSVFMDGVFFGIRNRASAGGCELERLAMADALAARLRGAIEALKEAG